MRIANLPMMLNLSSNRERPCISFENYLYGSDGSSIIVSLGMFAYRGRKAMINIEYQRGKTTAVDVTWERYDYKLDSDVAYTN